MNAFLRLSLIGAAILAMVTVSHAKVDVPFDGDTDGDILIIRGDGLLGWVERSGNGLSGVTAANNQGAGTVQELDIGDIDGDGNGDILTARNAGAATWTERNLNNLGGVTSQGVPSSHSIAVGDLDGDGDGDMIVGRDDGFITWMERVTAGSTLTSNFSTNAGIHNTLAIGDLDGDGDGDVVVGQASGLLAWQERSGNSLTGVFTGFNVTPAVTLEIGNLDNDGDGDIVIGRVDGFITYAERSGNSITSGVPAASTNLGSVADLALGDVNGDGEQEIIAVQAGNSAFLFVLDHNGSGISSIGNTQVGGGSNLITALDVGDLDGDAFLDVVVGRDDGTISWLEITNNGTTISGIADFNIGSPVVDLRIASAVPEPSSIVLLLVSSLVAMLSVRRRV